MRRLDIIYGHYISHVQGVNSVTNMFVHGKCYFQENEIEFKSIRHPLGKFDCIQNDDLYENHQSGAQNRKVLHKSRMISFLKRFISSTSLGEAFRFYVRSVLPAKRTIARIADNEVFDLIIFQDAISASYFFKRSIKYHKAIIILHTSGNVYASLEKLLPHINRSKFFSRWYKHFYEDAIAGNDNVVFLSPSIAQKIDIVPDKKKRYVFNGIENEPFAPIDHKKINIVCIGSVTKRKGQFLIIRSLSAICEEVLGQVNFYIVGTGDDLDNCKKLAAELGVAANVTFMGQQKGVNEIVRKMDVIILPSFEEGMPISIIEGMRQGLYTLVTPVGGCVDMITPEVGEFIERDPNSITKAVEHIVKDGIITDERKSIIRKHYDHNFTLKKMIDSYSMILLDDK